MKKYLYLIIIVSVMLVIIIVGITIKNVKSKDDVANKTYTYTEEGFGGDFTITIRDDGTASFYEGYLSSYIGEGTWNIENGLLFLNDSTFKNIFKVHDNELEFIEEGSMNFPYVKVKNGEKFIGKPLE